MDDIKAVARQEGAQPQSRQAIDRVAYPQRLADHIRRARPLPKQALGIAQQLGVVTKPQQLHRQAQNLAFATRKAQLRIDADDSQRLAGKRLAHDRGFRH